jgi:hypothetical protein
MDTQSRPSPRTKEEALENFIILDEMLKKLVEMQDAAEIADKAERYWENPDMIPAHENRWEPILSLEKEYNSFKEWAQDQYRRFAE